MGEGLKYPPPLPPGWQKARVLEDLFILRVQVFLKKLCLLKVLKGILYYGMNVGNYYHKKEVLF